MKGCEVMLIIIAIIAIISTIALIYWKRSIKIKNRMELERRLKWIDAMIIRANETYSFHHRENVSQKVT